LLSETQTTTKPLHAPSPFPYTHSPFTFLCKGWSYKKKPKSVPSQTSQAIPQENIEALLFYPKLKQTHKAQLPPQSK